MNIKELEQRIAALESEIERLRARNRRVAGDKAWETSLTRKIAIMVITYVLAAMIMYAIGVADYLHNALIPVVGYFLSTQTIPFLKRWYLQNNHKPVD